MSRVTKGNNGVTNPYGNGHHGVDIGYHSKPESDNQILAHTDGKVVSVEKNHNWTDKTGKSYGNYIKIKHANGYYTLYAHLKSVDVKNGDYVKQGQKIGVMGATGHAVGRHLHFEVRKPITQVRIDPTPYIYANLPGSSEGITYQSWDCKKNKWLPNVKANTNNYAGNIGNAAGGIYIDKLEYRVHDLKKKKWLPYVVGRNDFAGNKTPIDGLQVKGATYRVHVKGKGWLDWVSKCDDTSSGYAGIYGKEIDAVQIKVN